MGIGTGTRKSINKNAYQPGPGHYDNIQSSDNLYCRPNYAFSKGDRNDSSPQKGKGTPGPSHYRVPCYVADVPKYVLPNPPMPEFRYV